MGISSSPIVGIFLKIVIIVLTLNRILYTISTYKKMIIEREEDLFLKRNFCDVMDHKDLGRHTTICLENNRKLASSIIFHTFQKVIDDTLYRELQFHTIIQVTGIFASVIIIGALHSKYIKDNRPMNLPITSKTGIKID
jgi:hypothetical protein